MTAKKHQNALQIIATLTRYEGTVMPFSAVAKVAGIAESEANICMMWLRSQQYVTVHKGEHIVTTKGQEYYRETMIRNGQSDSKAFKEEVLSGLSQKKSDKSGFMISAQSEIENAVLSTCKMPIDRSQSPEEIAIVMQDRRRAIEFICENLGLSKSLYAKMMEEGRILVCNGHNREKHIGIFDKMKDRVQYLCRECMKKYRGKE